MMLAPFAMELRLRARTTALCAFALVAVAAGVGALFPAFSESIGGVDLPAGVENLIGGDLSTISGWLDTEIARVYGPLIFVGIAVTAAATSIAGEEERGILALVLAQPVSRVRLLLCFSSTGSRRRSTRSGGFATRRSSTITKGTSHCPPACTSPAWPCFWP